MSTSIPFSPTAALAASLRRVVRYAVFGLAAVGALSFQPEARAQTYPARTIRIVVGFGTGGQSDILSRLLAQKLSSQLNQAVIVENKPGAGGNIASELVAKSPADGYTLLLVASSLVVNPSLFKRVNYDPVRDFAPVALLTTYPVYLVANPAAPATVKDLITAAKARPGSINYASSGQGTSTHIAPELFASVAGVKFTHVPYKGGGQAVMAVTSGETQIHFGGSAVLPLVKAGRLRMLAVTNPTRMAAFPDVPTVAESLPGFELKSWNGLFAPAGTPPAIVKLLNAEVTKALEQPETIESLKNLDLEPSSGAPEDFGALVKSEYVKWTRTIKDLGITAE